ncbi:hypothetical protein CgunFtcFv8_001748 [Champsocephalus gunnari]|uniref:Uncharacterized protein n=1 Tax=Champsocephalus gunnari TaxID=52237 RepID=A0AAN8CL65_CHAGU|nr:hypothetical protein CgunFtcFv8_001748 [Champsocephalus gunnari]
MLPVNIYEQSRCCAPVSARCPLSADRPGRSPDNQLVITLTTLQGSRNALFHRPNRRINNEMNPGTKDIQS